MIVAFALAPANEADLPVATDALLPDVTGLMLADRNYRSARRHRPWIAPGVRPLIPPKHRKNETTWPRNLTHERRRIETVSSQLVGRYRSERLWARGLRHLSVRWLRTAPSHTIAAFLCQHSGPPLQLDKLLTH